MSKNILPFNPKVDVFMPLYIGRYLQDTTELDGAESGFYLHLLMHVWTTGPLPNDDRKLATIAKTSPDAWSIASASIKHYLFLGPDGMLHQRGAERMKAEWMEKRLKAHEKAQKAANARWGKYRAKVGEGKAKNGDAPSTARAMPYNGKYQVQKQKQPPPTPSAPRRGMNGPNGSMHQASPPSTSRPASSPIAASAAGKAKRTKGENAVKAPRTRPNGQVGGIHPKNSSGGVARKSKYVAPGAKRTRDPRKRDPREEGFQGEVFAYWKDLNPEHPKCPWDESDRRALQALLIKVSDLSLAEFKRLLKNRAASEVNASAQPHKWLRSLPDYSAGPLGPYGKPLRATRVM